MTLHGGQLIGGEASTGGGPVFHARAPRTGHDLEPAFRDASAEEINRALLLAAAAAEDLRARPAAEIAALLDRIAADLGHHIDALVDRAAEETALGRDRLTGEVARTQHQLRLFADLVRTGDWRDARIDRAQPGRTPLPKADLRRVLVPIGPVAVWAASNFPFAFSVAGGDTASALAAGNPVIVKAHPAHPGTSELVGRLVADAIEALGLPLGTFSLLHGTTPETSLALVRHPLLEAASFTGSLRAGRALFDAASRRPTPIPFFAEMGSVNPVFILPEAAAARAEAVADGAFQSVTLGVGQFCTNPGLIIGVASDGLSRVTKRLRDRFADGAPGSMLYGGIRDRYEHDLTRVSRLPGVRATRSSRAANAEATEVAPVLFETDAGRFLGSDDLKGEVFGPCTILITCDGVEDLARVARNLDGSLTATVHGTDADLLTHRALVTALESRVGRLVLNGYPTGVEVCPSMQHGGPYPATTDVRFTSVGTGAIQRFARPLCYQNAPQALLPPELRDDNPRRILRIVDGVSTRDGW